VIPPGGLTCGPRGCEHTPERAGRPAADGGRAVRSQAGRPRKGRAAQAAPGYGAPAIVQPQLTYQTVTKWVGGFRGQITITFPAGPVPPAWRLRLSYPTGHVVSASPVSKLQHGGHGAVVRSTAYPGGQGHTFAVTVLVEGIPGPPGTCAFDGRPCRIG
jgi:hypothetical protein